MESVRGERERMEKKKNDGRSSITIVVMGDEGVGKSSLISTFVSRHFSEMVPGVMTRVRLPPDNTLSPISCDVPSSRSKGFITSIVDTQNGDSALMAALAAAGGVAFPSSSFSPSSSITSLSKAAAAPTSTTASVPPTLSPTRPSPTNSSNSNLTGSRISASSSQRLVSSMEVDVIVLVYDMDRIDTFLRLENHWLPLLERCFGEEVPVIIAGNKNDLRLSDTQHTMSTATASPVGGGANSNIEVKTSHKTDRQRIVALLQRFKFVRQCIKCSAKTLFHVSEIFHKAQHAVLYPIAPLYDLKDDRLTDDCQRAFVRIFRMMDVDCDGLLSSAELKAFQNKCFRVWGPLLDENISGWKKILSKKSFTKGRGILGYDVDKSGALIRDGKFTVAGFLAIFDIFMSKDRWEVPWQILRIFGYDDALDLQIPSAVKVPPLVTRSGGGRGKSKKQRAPWELSPSALRFLASVFHQFDSDKDGILSEQDILNIFSIVPEPSLPPWHPSRSKKVFRDSFSRPVLTKCSNSVWSSPSSVVSGSQSFSASVTTMSSGDLIVPPCDLGLEGTLSDDVISPSTQSQCHPSFSFLDWMGYWQMSSVVNSTATRVELFRLGHVDNSPSKGSRSRKRRKASGNAFSVAEVLPSTTLRVKVLGSQGCGKTSLISALCQLESDELAFGKSILTTEKTKTPLSSCAHVQFSAADFIGPSKSGKRGSKGLVEQRSATVNLILTEIPEIIVHKMESSFLTEHCDLIVLTFDCSDSSSFAFARDLESRHLTDEVPRVYMGLKRDEVSTDRCASQRDSSDSPDGEDSDVQGSGGDAEYLRCHESISRHCKDLDIEMPLITKVANNGLPVGFSPGSRVSILKHLVRCSPLEEYDSIPDDLPPLKSKPLAMEKRRLKEAKRRKMIWFGGMFGVSIIVVVGTVLWPKKEKISWLKNLIPRRHFFE